MAWIVETLNAAVDAEVNDLPTDMRAQLVRISFMIHRSSGWSECASRM